MSDETSADTASSVTTRRTFLRASLATAAGTAAIGASSGRSVAQEGEFDGWFDGVDNYDGVVDATGQESVTVEVGTQANGGAFGFTPAAVRVSPGTTVVWEWTGEGGTHNVKAEDGSFESETVSEAGYTFEETFDAESVFKYVCSPHRSLGMKGAVVVGASDDSGSSAGGGNDGGSGGPTNGGDLLTGIVAGVVLTLLFLLPIADLREQRTKD